MFLGLFNINKEENQQLKMLNALASGMDDPVKAEESQLKIHLLARRNDITSSLSPLNTAPLSSAQRAVALAQREVTVTQDLLESLRRKAEEGTLLEL